MADDFAGRDSLGGRRHASTLDLIGRLKPGVALAVARADLDVIAPQNGRRHPGEPTLHGRQIYSKCGGMSNGHEVSEKHRRAEPSGDVRATRIRI